MAPRADFDDDNAAWLKPKKKGKAAAVEESEEDEFEPLLDDDEEEESEDEADVLGRADSLEVAGRSVAMIPEKQLVLFFHVLLQGRGGHREGAAREEAGEEARALRGPWLR